MSDAVIRVDNVSFSYQSSEKTTVGVRQVTLEVQRGEFLVLLGHNGSGKSTLAKLLNGFLLPDTGDVLVDGMNTKTEEAAYDIRSKVGIVFQNPDNQMVASIIEDDIAFGPENLGVPREEIARRVDWALSVVRMSEHRERTPFKLSGGQKQRISIAAILAMLPEVLILDESTAMLDPEGRQEVLDTVRRLNKEEGMTVILITHYMDEAAFADRVVVLKDGSIFMEGTPRQIFRERLRAESAKLELPQASLIAAYLQEHGVPIGEVLTDEELSEELCRLL